MFGDVWAPWHRAVGAVSSFAAQTSHPLSDGAAQLGGAL